MSSMHLALKYLRYHFWRTVILVICLTITVSLPISVRVLIYFYQKDLNTRAEATPLVMGKKGHRFDLIMNALYFRTNLSEYLSMLDFKQLQESGLAQGLPVFARYTARKIPVAGVTSDYFFYRRLTPQSGSLPILLGDAVMGHKAANKLKVKVGDSIFSDQTNLYNISSQYPLKLKIVGILEPNRTIDDEVIFVDLQTAWIIDGLGHGHADLGRQDQKDKVLKKEKGNIVGNASVTVYQEITPENINSYHFHGGDDTLPLTALICLPKNQKSATILRARFSLNETKQLLDSKKIVKELLSMVFKVERFLHFSFLLIAFSTLLLLVNIIILSIRLRIKEFQTMQHIGCSPSVIIGMQVIEWAFILFFSFILCSGIIIILLSNASKLTVFFQ